MYPTAAVSHFSKKWYAALAIALSMMMATQLSAAVGAPTLDLGAKIEQVLVDLTTSDPTAVVPVVVSQKSAESDDLRSLVKAGGGTVTKSLPIVDGFSAEIPARLISSIGMDPNLRSLSLNRVGRFESMTYDESTVASSAPKSTGATQLWAKGNYGEGVGVAVIDTGISPMNDFTKNGYRLIHGPDLSGENSMIDTYGHGTVMAGIIAGDGYDSAANAGGAHVGLAPKAWLVSVKVAGANGAADVSTVLAAMHWVSAYRDQFNIRVVNLAWGTKGTQSYKLDPLNYAVERLWQMGITVVVAAGNSGPGAGTITKPADDPFVITVGAYNDKQNSDPADDNVPSWSSNGPTAADGLIKPDVVAPGRLIISQRSYGSTIEKEFPKALYSPSYIRGSGSSQASAAVSGLAALLIRQKPSLSPDQVKHLLKSTASPINNISENTQGKGRVNVAAAAASTDTSYANTTVAPASGLGSLEASRGGGHIQTDCGNDGIIDIIQGEITAQCEPWNGGSWTGGSWTGGSWTGGSWTGGSWTGGSWTGGSWTGGSWTGGSWTGGSWTGGSWTTSDFTGGSWTGGSWTGGSWTGGSWTGGSWTGGSWTGGSWTGGSWTTGTYDEFTSAAYDEFLTAFWGNKTRAGKRLPGEESEPLNVKLSRS